VSGAGRVLGLDLGSRRIGVAISDPTGTVATPFTVIERAGDRQADYRRIADLVAEENATVVVVGLPVSLSGALGPAARTALVEIEALSATLAVPVETHDERLTTVSAQRALDAGGLPRRRQRRVVDKVAAAVMLQSWLECKASTGP
jgi:putative Holliday junction resolvase